MEIALWCAATVMVYATTCLLANARRIQAGPLVTGLLANIGITVVIVLAALRLS